MFTLLPVVLGGLWVITARKIGNLSDAVQDVSKRIDRTTTSIELNSKDTQSRIGWLINSVANLDDLFTKTSQKVNDIDKSASETTDLVKSLFETLNNLSINTPRSEFARLLLFVVGCVYILWLLASRWAPKAPITPKTLTPPKTLQVPQAVIDGQHGILFEKDEGDPEVEPDTPAQTQFLPQLYKAYDISTAVVLNGTRYNAKIDLSRDTRIDPTLLPPRTLGRIPNLPDSAMFPAPDWQNIPPAEVDMKVAVLNTSSDHYHHEAVTPVVNIKIHVPYPKDESEDLIILGRDVFRTEQVKLGCYNIIRSDAATVPLHGIEEKDLVIRKYFTTLRLHDNTAVRVNVKFPDMKHRPQE